MKSKKERDENKSIAHLQPPGAQPVPEHCPCTNLSPSLLLNMLTHGLEYPQVGWAHLSWLCPFPVPWAPSSSSLLEWGEEQKRL